MIIEAMGQGVPVITTPSSGTPITSGNDGMLVEVRNPEALANSIEGLIEDRNLREQIASTLPSTQPAIMCLNRGLAD